MPNRKLPKGGSVIAKAPGTCRYCGIAAVAARIDHQGERIEVCAYHNPSCGNCICYAPASEGSLGECRRVPPVLVMLEGELRTAYPDVDPKKDWCVDGFVPR